MQTQIAFHDIVDIIYRLTSEQKEEIKDIVEKSLIEERREEIYRNCIASEKEYKQGKVKTAKNINEFKKLLK